MDSKPMIIEVKPKDGLCLVRCEGRLVTADHEYLHAKKDEIKGANCKKVLADFSEVPEIGSAGIGFIVGVYTSTKNSGGRFVLVGLRPRVREVLDITRVSTVIPLAADVASGLVTLCDEGLATGAQN
jgi:anti-sigma B factor antagonist